MGTEYTIEINGRVLTGWRKALAIPFVWLFGAGLAIIVTLAPFLIGAAMTFPVWGPLLLLAWWSR